MAVFSHQCFDIFISDLVQGRQFRKTKIYNPCLIPRKNLFYFILFLLARQTSPEICESLTIFFKT